VGEGRRRPRTAEHVLAHAQRLSDMVTAAIEEGRAAAALWVDV
jgi:hypothetical protein